MYWPWWAGALALAGVMLVHWLLVGRTMAVSGRITALVDRLRHGAPDADAELSPEELAQALSAAALEEFGGAEGLEGDHAALDGQDDVDDLGDGCDAPLENAPAPPLVRGSRPRWSHPLFLVGLVAGGWLSAVCAGRWHPALTPQDPAFIATFGDQRWWAALVLLTGGTLVGFGTRMAGGCTSGHGLCGTSRMQLASWVTTVVFMASGIATAYLLRWL